MTMAMLTGQSTEHLAVLCGHHRLQPEAIEAFQALQRAAKMRDLIYSPQARLEISLASRLFGMPSLKVSVPF